MKRILLADDEENLRMLVHLTLEDPKFEIHEAADGFKALQMARELRPDLVLLDWMMPVMSGIDTAKALRQDPQTTHIPIIMLTAKGQERDKETAAALGVAHYLIKPFSPLDLLAKVENLLSD